MVKFLLSIHYQCSGDRGIILTLVTYLSVCLGYWIRSNKLPDSIFCWTAMVVVGGVVLGIGKLSRFLSTKWTTK